MKLTTPLKKKNCRNQVVEWMAENRVLSAALEGNIDQGCDSIDIVHDSAKRWSPG